MNLIEEFEHTKRGLYSGSVGYITPEGDFDFNVIIRSLQYNAANKYLSYMVGGAITDNSDPEGEYLECEIKAASIKKVLARSY
jgi:para-aminobenzoate synthetase component 1